MKSIVAAVLVLVGAAGCSRTEIVLGVGASIEHPGQIDAVELEIRDQYDAKVFSTEWPLDPGVTGSIDLPGTIGLLPTSGSGGVVQIVLWGSSRKPDGTLQHVVSRRSTLQFLPSHTLFLRMVLVVSCIELEGKCGAGQWCAGGECRPIVVDPGTLPEYHPGDEKQAQCGDATLARAAGLTPAATADCAPGSACIDFECVRLSVPVESSLDLMTDGARVLDSAADWARNDDLPSDGAVAVQDATLDGMTLDLVARAADLTGGAPPDLAALVDGAPLDSAVADSATTDFAGSPIFDLTQGGLDRAAPRDLAVDGAAPELTADGMPDLMAPPPDQLTVQTLSPNFKLVSPLGASDAIVWASYDSANTTGSPWWAVTTAGDALSYDPTAKKLVVEHIGSYPPLRAVFVSGGDVWACGDDATLLHRAPASMQWSIIDVASHIPGASHLYTLLGAGPGMVEALGTLDAGSGSHAYSFVSDALGYQSQGLFLIDLTPRRAFASPDGMNGLVVGDSKVNGGGSLILRRTVNSSPIWASAGNGFQVPDTLSSVWGGGGVGSMAVGTSGSAYRFDGSTWIKTNTGVSGTLRTIASGGFDAIDLIAAGDDGLLHWATGAWMPAGPSPTGGAVDGVASGGPQAVTAPDGGTKGNPPGTGAPGGAMAWRGGASYVFDGMGWTQLPGAAITRIDGKPAALGSYFFAPSGTEVWGTTNIDGGKWENLPVQAGCGHLLQGAYTPTGDTAYIVGDQGCLQSGTSIWNGVGFAYAIPSDSTRTFTGVWAADASNVYVSATGSDGKGYVLTNRLGSYAPDSGFLSLGFTRVLAVGGSAADDVYAVGTTVAGGVIARFDGNAWRVEKTTQLPLRAVWAGGPGDVWAVGDGGACLRRDAAGGAFYSQATGTAAPLTDVHGTSINDVFAVGQGGLFLGFDGGKWNHFTVPTTVNLTGVWADSANVWIGGADQLLRWKRP